MRMREETVSDLHCRRARLGGCDVVLGRVPTEDLLTLAINEACSAQPMVEVTDPSDDRKICFFRLTFSLS